MEDFEKSIDTDEVPEIENKEEIGALDDAAVDGAVFEEFDANKDFLLSDDPEDKKSGFPIFGVIAIIVALAIAVGFFLVVRHNNKKNAETILITSNNEDVTAEIRDGEIYINDQKIDPEDIGIDPDDPEQLEEYVSSVNKGTVTVPNKVAEKYSIKTSPSKTASSGNNSSSDPTANSSAATKKGEIVKPNGVVITSPVAKKFEVGYKGKVAYGLTPLGQVSSSQRGVSITSSDPSVVTVDHLGNFKAVGKGTATITVQSKVTPTAKASVTLTIVDTTTTLNVVVPTITTTTKPTTTTTTTTTTTKPSTTRSGEIVEIQSMKFTRASGIDGSYKINMRKGGSVSLGISFTPSDASYSDVTFSSDNPSVCTVSASGVVVARGVGETTVRVTPKKGTAGSLTAYVTVSE